MSYCGTPSVISTWGCPEVRRECAHLPSSTSEPPRGRSPMEGGKKVVWEEEEIREDEGGVGGK